MYFQIENTPEHIRRARRTEVVQKKPTKEECPRLILAPFSKPPQVVFEDVIIATTCEKVLEIFNPSKQVQQITLGKPLPPGLVIQLPGEWLVLEPETCYCLTMTWTPMQPTALRETIRFTHENRGRYEIVVVLKSAMKVKGKRAQGFKTSPGKITKKTSKKKSPVSIYKKLSENIYNTTTIKKTVVQSTHYNVVHQSNKENIFSDNDNPMTFQPNKCPFDSMTSNDFTFDTFEVFPNLKKTNTEKNLQNTYDKSYTSNPKLSIPDVSNILTPSNKQDYNMSASELFDNLTYTPLKATNSKSEKLCRGPKVILSVNSDSELDDSLEIKRFIKDNENHSIVSITSAQTSKWVPMNHKQNILMDNQFAETAHNQNKKVPNTSSPKEFNSPNFTMNTELSRISDLSFLPQRYSTEKKILPKPNNETHELFEDAKLNSDTYTKDSPITPSDFQINQVEQHAPHYFTRDHPKICRQALFRECQQSRDTFERHYFNPLQANVWNKDGRVEARSPVRSITPPLQSIPEESTNVRDTLVIDKSGNQNSFTANLTMNRTFDKMPDRSSLSTSVKQTWSKKSVRADPEIWKIPAAPPRKSMKPKTSFSSKDSLNGKMCNTLDNSKNINKNISLCQVGNVYSQSFTVDPFLSSSYFYDEEAVHKLEAEFMRWLNYILTPPADLDSNVEQKVDVGKAWLENRNREVPAAPTKEQVCSIYHNSYRLESLRRSARMLLKSPEMSLVFQKLHAQIEKKLIAIRIDRNLHLDVGLQKVIMEILLSYNPLWLRIGLEAIYGIVLPLKSNSDIDGLTTFIIQRMYKNPYLKNKHSKSTGPNVLLPAYMEAIKKFTLKKFFMLVFFLDQAKQKKLIPHDPCLFCRNAICKESREVIIRFTRELIAGIGDITKHLRPIGYVVCHKQSYLDEYKYAVHNIALDIRDGVRLTKVMEIILMKNGLLHQLRTPAISRLQKIHNVQIALNALKDANFVIEGDITAQDIADGHREKTLSLLWQLIHVFRAPLFERAANVIQVWWRKKYEVILEKRKEEEKLFQKLTTAASIIQCWWRRTQYNRLVEWQMKKTTSATIVFQKYCRMWLCRTRLQKMKRSVLKIEKWYYSIRMIREAKATLAILKMQREELRQKSATILQSFVRRWLCKKQYRDKLQKITLIQSVIRCFILRKRYIKLKKSTIHIQQLYRGKLQMKQEMKKFSQMRNATTIIQSNYRMLRERRLFLNLKKSVKTIEERYIALLKMRTEVQNYKQLQQSVTLIQARWRGTQGRKIYLKQRNAIVLLQRKIRAHFLMKQQRNNFLKMKNAATILQRHIRSYKTMKKVREAHITLRNSAIVIQRRFRAQRLMKLQRELYIQQKKSAIVFQTRYMALLAMRQERSSFLSFKKSAITLQRRYRALTLMRHHRNEYENLRKATISIQMRFRAQLIMKKERSRYLKLQSACLVIQNKYRAYRFSKQQRELYLNQKLAAITIQNWFRNCKQGKVVKKQYQQIKQACITVQRIYRAYIIGRKQSQEYIKIKTSIVRIQNYYRSYIEMKRVREQFIKMKTATVTIQRFYKSYLKMKKQRQEYLQIKSATEFIQNYYRRYREAKLIHKEYCELRQTTIFIQKMFRSIYAMRNDRRRFLSLKIATVTIQRHYRAMLEMKSQRKNYQNMRQAVINIQTRFRAHCLMKEERIKYLIIRNACISIQRFYREYLVGRREREKYLTLKKYVIVVQQQYKALITMRKERKSFLALRTAVINVQRKYRARMLMIQERANYRKVVNASVTIQRAYRAYVHGKRQLLEYITLKTATTTIQIWYRRVVETRKIRSEYLQLKNAVLFTQRGYRAKVLIRATRRQNAVIKIQTWFRSLLKRNECRNQYFKLKSSAVIIQSSVRMFIQRKKFLVIKNAATTIQIFYRSYKLSVNERQKYRQLRSSIIKLQSYVRSFICRKRYIRIRDAVLTLQTAYRLKKQRELMKIRRETAAICIQKHFRRYLEHSRYQHYRHQVLFIQKLWRGKLVTRLLVCEFNQKRRIIINLQARIRGYLVRSHIQSKREDILRMREEKKRHWAAGVIQAHYRGHKVRVAMDVESRVTKLRRRWREGALKSTQESLKERHEHAMGVLRNIHDIDTVITAFESLKLTTEIFPNMYNKNASSIVRKVYAYMSVTNRSISSIEVLVLAASVLVNLTRYRGTGPKIYARDRIDPILKYMLRFTNSEQKLFCILCTYLWLFSKYDGIREDLTEYLNIPENKKMLTSINNNVERVKRMAKNTRQVCQTRRTSHINYSICSNSDKNDSILLPASEPVYGINRADRPHYFEDASQAITCLFQTFDL